MCPNTPRGLKTFRKTDNSQTESTLDLTFVSHDLDDLVARCPIPNGFEAQKGIKSDHALIETVLLVGLEEEVPTTRRAFDDMEKKSLKQVVAQLMKRMDLDATLDNSHLADAYYGDICKGLLSSMEKHVPSARPSRWAEETMTRMGGGGGGWWMARKRIDESLI